MTTCLHISLMLHYHSVAEPFEKNDARRRFAPAVIEFTKQLIDDGLLYADPDGPSGYRCTDRGVAYVEALKAMPLPVAETVWKIPA